MNFIFAKKSAEQRNPKLQENIYWQALKLLFSRVGFFYLFLNLYTFLIGYLYSDFFNLNNIQNITLKDLSNSLFETNNLPNILIFIAFVFGLILIIDFLKISIGEKILSSKHKPKSKMKILLNAIEINFFLLPLYLFSAFFSSFLTNSFLDFLALSLSLFIIIRVFIWCFLEENLFELILDSSEFFTLVFRSINENRIFFNLRFKAVGWLVLINVFLSVVIVFIYRGLLENEISLELKGFALSLFLGLLYWLWFVVIPLKMAKFWQNLEITKLQISQIKNISSPSVLKKFIINLVVILLLILQVVGIAISHRDFSQTSVSRSASAEPIRKIDPINQRTKESRTEFLKDEIAFINDFNVSVNQVHWVNSKSPNLQNFCLVKVRIFNFGSATSISSDQLILSSKGKEFEINNKIFILDNSKLNYSATIDTQTEGTLNLYFDCTEPPEDDLSLIFKPFRDGDFLHNDENYPVINTEQEALSKVNFKVNSSEIEKFDFPKNPPVQIEITNAELTEINQIKYCKMNIKITNIGLYPWIFSETELNLTQNDNIIARFILNQSDDINRKYLINSKDTIELELNFGCNKNGDFILKYEPQIGTQYFLEKTLNTSFKI